MTPQEKQRIAEGLLGEIDWRSETEGFCRCPGFEKHTTPPGERDCRVKVDGVPTISCFHSSCEAFIKAYNSSLRIQIGSGEETGKKKKPRRPKPQPQWVRAVRSAERVKEKFPVIFRSDSPWWKGPHLKPLSLETARALFWNLFEPDDIMWIGWCQDSGVRGLGHFHPLAYWQRQKSFCPFTCTGVFHRTHGHARSAENILRQKYDVIEFDRLSPDPHENQWRGIALFFYLAEINPLVLRMIVDTGNKSVHFWVDHNEQLFDKFYLAFLKALGADTNGFKPSQPVRFPGVYRQETMRPQTVLTL